MAKAKVGLYLRYRQEGKQSPYRPVCWDAKKRLRPFWCMVRGVEEHHPERSYHLRYGVNGKQVWEPVGGADPIALRNSRTRDLNNPKDSSSQRLVEIHAAVEVLVPRAAKDRLTLDDAIDPKCNPARARRNCLRLMAKYPEIADALKLTVVSLYT